ncbi:MAG: glycosyltransferase [Treponema sp.]|nr:glycosyltransferase [Treponema sp.]
MGEKMISVCIAAYNGEKYLKLQLVSILDQLSNNDEIIISDDGSTDRTLEVIEEINDSRIKVFSHKSDRSLLTAPLGNYTIVAKNFENALLHANGDFIFMSDQDDLWEKNRISTCINALNKYSLVMTNYKVIDKNDKIKSGAAYKVSPIYNNICFNIIRSRFMCCCLAFRRELLCYAVPFPYNLQSCEQWLGNIATKYGRIKFLKNTYHLYRRHGANVSETTGKSRNTLKQKLGFRYLLYKQLRERFFEIKQKRGK